MLELTDVLNVTIPLTFMLAAFNRCSDRSDLYYWRLVHLFSLMGGQRACVRELSWGGWGELSLSASLSALSAKRDGERERALHSPHATSHVHAL